MQTDIGLDENELAAEAGAGGQLRRVEAPQILQEIQFVKGDSALGLQREPEAFGDRPVVDEEEGLRVVGAGLQRLDLGLGGFEDLPAQVAKTQAAPRGRFPRLAAGEQVMQLGDVFVFPQSGGHAVLAKGHFFEVKKNGGQGLETVARPRRNFAVQIHAEGRSGLPVEEARHDFLSAE
jgi:hypothetical protein